MQWVARPNIMRSNFRIQTAKWKCSVPGILDPSISTNIIICICICVCVYIYMNITQYIIYTYTYTYICIWSLNIGIHTYKDEYIHNVYHIYIHNSESESWGQPTRSHNLAMPDLSTSTSLGNNATDQLPAGRTQQIQRVPRGWYNAFRYQYESTNH